MRKKRPCSICRKWFLPAAHQATRQTTCGSKECRREKHRRACRDWRRCNPDYDRDRRLRDRLTKEDTEETLALSRVDPLSRLDQSVVRDAIGLEGSVIIEESSGVIVKWVRDALEAETEQRRGFPRRLIPPGLRDAIGGEAGAP